MEASGFQQAVRSATPTYPIPFAFAIGLLFAALCFGGSLEVEGALRWALAGTAIFATLSSFGLLGYAVLAKNELLRSEQHVLLMAVSNVIGDRDMDPATRERVSRAVLEAADKRLPKSAVHDPSDHDDKEQDR